MTVSGQYPTPPQQQAGSGAGRTALLILLGVGCMAMFCCGGFAILGALLFTRTKTDLQRMQASIQSRAQRSRAAPGSQTDWTDWIAMSQLTPVFTAALDAVATDKQVIERLGTPIETAGDSDKLFRREKTGQWTGADEALEFDIQGPQGRAVVRVTTAAQNPAPDPPGRSNLRPDTITVTFTDGAQIDVPMAAHKDP
jgi:Cytochrome oxidase complex assembly protein 1